MTLQNDAQLVTLSAAAAAVVSASATLFFSSHRGKNYNWGLHLLLPLQFQFGFSSFCPEWREIGYDQLIWQLQPRSDLTDFGVLLQKRSGVPDITRAIVNFITFHYKC